MIIDDGWRISVVMDFVSRYLDFFGDNDDGEGQFDSGGRWLC